MAETEKSLPAHDAEKRRVFSLVGRLSEAVDPAERERLKEELPKIAFRGLMPGVASERGR